MTTIVYYNNAIAADRLIIAQQDQYGAHIQNGPKAFTSKCRRIAFAICGDIPSASRVKDLFEIINTLLLASHATGYSKPPEYVETLKAGNASMIIMNSDRTWATSRNSEELIDITEYTHARGNGSMQALVGIAYGYDHAELFNFLPEVCLDSGGGATIIKRSSLKEFVGEVEHEFLHRGT